MKFERSKSLSGNPTGSPQKQRAALRNRRKILSHLLKRALYGNPVWDAWLDARFQSTANVWGQSYRRLFPERSHREVNLYEGPSRPGATITILSLIPPEDSTGASRSARLAEEFRRSGWAIDWRWALPSFPWPQITRPQRDGWTIHHISESIPLQESSFVLIEAPHPAFLPLIDSLQGSPSIFYEQIDLWTGDLARGWFDPEAERQIATRADKLIATSQPLCQHLGDLTGRFCEYIPNGVDARLFRAEQKLSRPDDLKVGHPTILYVGALWGDWIDLDLLANLADQLPGAELHLIGRAEPHTLPRRKNIHPLGERPRTTIPAYLQHSDVALIPFRSTPVARAASPLKAFEALAMDCPIVTTPLPELAGISGVYTADPSEFASAVIEAARAPVPPSTGAAIRNNFSWESRAREILGLANASI